MEKNTVCRGKPEPYMMSRRNAHKTQNVDLCNVFFMPLNLLLLDTYAVCICFGPFKNVVYDQLDC